MTSESTLVVSVDIAARIDNVWAVVTDLAAYPQWHPHVASVCGELAPGQTIRMNPAGNVLTSLDLTVIDVDAPRLLVTEGATLSTCSSGIGGN